MLVLCCCSAGGSLPRRSIWTAGVSFLAITSEYVPPNPRMLITAFPAIMVVARYARGRFWTAAIWPTCCCWSG